MRAENRELLTRFEARVHEELGVDHARVVMMLLIDELGGLRITVPTMDEVERARRDKKIRTLFRGDNTAELGVRFDLSSRQIRRIVNGGDIEAKKKW